MLKETQPRVPVISPIRLDMPNGYKMRAALASQARKRDGNFRANSKSAWATSSMRPKMMTFPAGSFAYLDPDMHHYAMASGEVVVQVHGMSPLQFNYVNPADDPSKN